MNKKLEEIFSKLKTHSVDSLGERCSEKEISFLEKSLKIKIPFEYRFFLKEIGYAEVYGDELYSIYSVPDEIPCKGLHWMNIRNEELSKGYIEFFSNDIDGVFYIKEDNGEIYLNSIENKITNSFSAFLLMLLNS